MKECQKCNSPRVITVTAKCSDLFSASALNGKEYQGYVPELGIGGGDYVEFTYCLNCGQIQGKFPVPWGVLDRRDPKAKRPEPTEQLPYVTVPVKPEGYEDDLCDYGPLFVDEICGEVTHWGFKIKRPLDEERFDALGKYGYLVCLEPGTWGLATKLLTHEEAVVAYGKVTNIERGPRGGFRSITFGTTKFSQKSLLPRASEEWRPSSYRRAHG